MCVCVCRGRGWDEGILNSHDGDVPVFKFSFTKTIVIQCVYVGWSRGEGWGVDESF